MLPYYHGFFDMSLPFLPVTPKDTGDDFQAIRKSN